jgi:hypothetical protein
VGERFTDKLSEARLQGLAVAWRAVRPVLFPEES